MGGNEKKNNTLTNGHEVIIIRKHIINISYYYDAMIFNPLLR